jgi:hypothetical protein
MADEDAKLSYEEPFIVGGRYRLAVAPGLGVEPA